MADDQQQPETPAAADDPGREFAALMSSAAAAAAPQVPEAPYGWTTDPATGERRPKKTLGRPRKPPSLEELKAAKAAQDPAAGARGADNGAGDRAPARGKSKALAAGDGKPGDTVPQHRPGVITRGMNKRYRQLGKVVRPLDHDIGQALVDMTKNTADEPADGQEPEDNSVGACWDDVARVNPRIRKFCLAVIQGGAYGALVLAHTPLGVAIALKFVSANPGFVGRLILSLAEPDEDTPAGEGGLPFGMTAQDLGDLAKMAEKIIPGEVIRDAAAAAAAGQNGGPPGPFAHHGQGTRRQPKASTRAARKAS